MSLDLKYDTTPLGTVMSWCEFTEVCMIVGWHPNKHLGHEEPIIYFLMANGGIASDASYQEHPDWAHTHEH